MATSIYTANSTTLTDVTYPGPNGISVAYLGRSK